MQHKDLFILILCAWQLSTQAQESSAYMPIEFRKAYDEGTRSPDGKPGPGYWQNSVDYTMDVAIDPYGQTVTGSSEILFHNQSPDALTRINIRLLANVYQKGAARGNSTVAENITDGVRIKELRIRDTYLDPDRSQRIIYEGTNMFVLLAEPLVPGESLAIGCRWEQEIPKLIDYQRAGVVDSSRMFIAYWYPVVAVYDDIYGWDRVEYNLVNEFYNNLANYKVNITVPEGYNVWATGTLANPEEVYTESVLERFRKAQTTEKKVQVISAKNKEEAYPGLPTTWKFKAREVSDFAFVLGSDYHWDAATIRVEDRDVLLQVVYPAPMSGACEDLLDLQKESILHMSEDIPGVPYPYPVFTTAIGTASGGMEFPMMANNVIPDQEITIHEIFHTYLPMLVRVNERRWSWMDEGWAEHTTYLLEQRFFQDPPRYDKIYSSKNFNQLTRFHGTTADLPLITSSQFYTGYNHGYLTYQAPSLVFSILHQHLGDEMFLKCYREFILRWAKKAPIPFDMFNTFEDISGEDLSWLWDPWVFSSGEADLAIVSVEGDQVSVENKGNRPVPVILDIAYREGTREQVSESAAIWKDRTLTKIRIPRENEVETLDLNMELADRNMNDNLYPPYAERHPLAIEYKELDGTYVNRYGSSYTIEYKDRALYFRNNRFMEPAVMIYIEDLSFKLVQDDTNRIHFRKDDSGNVTGFDLEILPYGFRVNYRKIL